MNFIIILTVSLAFAICLLYLITLKKQNYRFKIINQKIKIKDWMSFDSIDRKRIDDESRIETMKRKKALLRDIRTEYLEYKNKNKR